MPTTPFCALDQAYGEWDNEEIKNKNRNISHNQQNHQQGPNHVQTPEKQKSEENINVDFDKGNDIRSFCPNCKNCLDRNDTLQQKIIDTTIWPRVRWIPQVPQSYAPYDPYNRYWAGIGTPTGREDFGNPYDIVRKNDNIEILLKITIFIVAVLFIILLVDILFKNKS